MSYHKLTEKIINKVPILFLENGTKDTDHGQKSVDDDLGDLVKPVENSGQPERMNPCKHSSQEWCDNCPDYYNNYNKKKVPNIYGAHSVKGGCHEECKPVEPVNPEKCSNFKECPCCGITFAHAKVKTLREKIAESIYKKCGGTFENATDTTKIYWLTVADEAIRVIEQEKKK